MHIVQTFGEFLLEFPLQNHSSRIDSETDVDSEYVNLVPEILEYPFDNMNQ